MSTLFWKFYGLYDMPLDFHSLLNFKCLWITLLKGLSDGAAGDITKYPSPILNELVQTFFDVCDIITQKPILSFYGKPGRKSFVCDTVIYITLILVFNFIELTLHRVPPAEGKRRIK